MVPRSPWRQIVFLVVLLTLAPLAAGGCLGNFAANQSRRQGARSADHYLRKYVQPELADLFPDDPDAQVEVEKITREGRNYLADVVVRSGNERQRRRILVDSKGRLIEER